MRAKQFKEKINTNRRNFNPVVQVEINPHLIICVDRKNFRVNEGEIKEQIRDLIRVKLSYTREEKIKLSQITDCCYDLKYIKGTIKGQIKKAYFALC